MDISHMLSQAHFGDLTGETPAYFANISSEAKQIGAERTSEEIAREKEGRGLGELPQSRGKMGVWGTSPS